eukprot:8736241-Alexandrium_andersonii.AAC.1
MDWASELMLRCLDRHRLHVPSTVEQSWEGGRSTTWQSALGFARRIDFVAMSAHFSLEDTMCHVEEVADVVVKARDHFPLVVST